MKRVHTGHRASAMGHNGKRNGRHAEMGCAQVPMRPAQHRILMGPKHSGQGGAVTERLGAEGAECFGRMRSRKVADQNPSKVILTNIQ